MPVENRTKACFQQFPTHQSLQTYNRVAVEKYQIIQIYSVKKQVYPVVAIVQNKIKNLIRKDHLKLLNIKIYLS